jgi:hypothetical protein
VDETFSSHYGDARSPPIPPTQQQPGDARSPPITSTLALSNTFVDAAKR